MGMTSRWSCDRSEDCGVQYQLDVVLDIYFLKYEYVGVNYLTES